MRRYKRFLADVEVPGRGEVVAHCPNPGSMATCMEEGGRVWLRETDDPSRKLAFTWELSRAGDDAMVLVNTSRANGVVEEALGAGVITELAGYARVRREVKYGERSRVDFLLEGEAGERCYVEVKNVTLGLGDRVSAFPDAVTTRGTRHLEELIRVVERGERAVMLFCCSRDPSREVQPADHIDARYGQALRRAAGAGVEILSYRCEINPEGVWLRERIPVVFPRDA